MRIAMVSEHAGPSAAIAGGQNVHVAELSGATARLLRPKRHGASHSAGTVTADHHAVQRRSSSAKSALSKP